MASKKKKEQKQAAAPKGAEDKVAGLTMGKLGLLTFLLVGAVIGAAGYFSYELYNKQTTKTLLAEQQGLATAPASLISGRTQTLGDVVADLAANPLLIDAVESGDEEAIAAALQTVRTVFPQALRIELITPRQRDPELREGLDLGFACLGLARHAETQPTLPPIEIHKPNNEDAHIDVVRPIKGKAGGVMASLMVTFDNALFKTWLSDLSTGAYVEVQQQAGEQLVTLVEQGNKTLRNGEPLARAMVAGTPWQVSYWGKTESDLGELDNVLFLSLSGGAIGISFLIIMIMAAVASGAVKRDLAILVNMFMDMSDNKRVQSVVMRMRDFQQASVAVDHHMQRVQVRQRDKAKNQPQLKPAEKDDSVVVEEGDDELDFSDVMFMDDTGVEVQEEGGSGAAKPDGK